MEKQCCCMRNDFVPSLSRIILILNSYIYLLLAFLSWIIYRTSLWFFYYRFASGLCVRSCFSSNPILSSFRHLIISTLPFSIIFVLFELCYISFRHGRLQLQKDWFVPFIKILWMNLEDGEAVSPETLIGMCQTIRLHISGDSNLHYLQR
jgi:hypothetical protein